MEILTMLRASLRKRKGSFAAIVILTFIIIAAVSSLLSTQQNFHEAYDDACEYADAADVNMIVAERMLDDETLEKVENSSLISRVTSEKCLICDGIVSIGEDTDKNGYFIFPRPENMRIYNVSGNGYETEDITLEKGEIFLPYGLKEKFKCNVGDTIKMSMETANVEGPLELEFTIKRFVQEPVLGGQMIGWKKVFVSEEEYASLHELFGKYETEDRSRYAAYIRLYQADEDMPQSKFQRELNLETGIGDKAFGVLSMEDSRKYTGLFVEIVSGVMIGFAVILFTIVLVMIGHSIKTEIEIDYVDLGVIKAQGFGSGKMSLVILLRYMLAELIGITLGIIAGLPLERFFSDIFFGITAVLPEKGLAVGKILPVILTLLVISSLTILLFTRKISRISPVRAISGGRNEIYFADRLNAPISPKFLSLTLAFRCFTANKKRYIGAVFITALLTYFAVTVNIMKNMITSRSALDLMGFLNYDLRIEYDYDNHPETEQQVNDIVEKYTNINKRYNYSQRYASLNGEKIMMQYYQYPEYIPGLVEGRRPLYPNEIMVTKPVAEMLDLKISDEVTVTIGDKSSQYMITGLYQCISDTGVCFAISLDGTKAIGVEGIGRLLFVLDDTSQIDEIVKEINDTFGEYASAENATIDTDGDNLYMAADYMRYMVFVFAALFSLVSVMMICSKAFIQERTDIGVLRSMGFTASVLRRQFTLRYTIAAIAGSVIGSIAGLLWSGDLLNVIFSTFGIYKVFEDNTPMLFISASAFICACTAVFSYLASRKIKKVSPRELITE